VRFDRRSPRGGSTSMKLGSVTAYVGSVTLVSWRRMTSAVAAALLSRVSSISGLRFMLCEMIRMVAASGLYLCMGGHVGVVVGSSGSSSCGSGVSPGLSDCSVLNRAACAEGGVIGGGASDVDAIAAFVVNVWVRLSMAVRAKLAPVFVGRVILCAEAAGGAGIRFAGGVVVA
jgi:hypothetical protein